MRDRESDVVSKAEIGVVFFQDVGKVHKQQDMYVAAENSKETDSLLRACGSNQTS